MEQPDQTPKEVTDSDSKVGQAVKWLHESWTDEAEQIYTRSAASGRGRIKLIGVETFLFLREITRGFLQIEATGRAAALAYTTLLSLIPLIVALWQVLRTYFAQIFPDLKVQVDMFLNLLIPYQSAQITYQLTRAAENAAALSTFGTIAFILIAFRLFMTVETIVNMTWKVEGARTYRQKIRAFTMLFFWGPILIGLSFTAKASMDRNPMFGYLAESELMQWVLPLGVFFIAFTMLFWLVPATRVRLRSAAIGGAVTTALFELVRLGFGIYAGWLFRGTMDPIYGTLGLLVIFLISLELMWLVILFGVEVSYVHQNFQGILRASEKKLADEPRLDVYFGLHALIEIVRRYQAREEAPTANMLAEQLGSTDAQMSGILRRLEDSRIVKEIGGDWCGWVPGSDPAALTLEEVVRDLENGGQRKVPGKSEAVESVPDRAIRGLLAAINAAASTAAAGRTLGDLVREVYGDEVPRGEPAPTKKKNRRSQRWFASRRDD